MPHLFTIVCNLQIKASSEPVYKLTKKSSKERRYDVSASSPSKEKKSEHTSTKEQRLLEIEYRKKNPHEIWVKLNIGGTKLRTTRETLLARAPHNNFFFKIA